MSSLNLHEIPKEQIDKLARHVRPKQVRCKSESCKGRKTPHFPNRSGVNGRLWVCRVCGEERTL